LHHTSHDKLERFLGAMTDRADRRAKFSGATVDVIALAAVRATREAMVARGRDKLPAITGIRSPARRSAAIASTARPKFGRLPGDLPERSGPHCRWV
jgi:predicted YcjX-like family ATPase